MLESGKKYREKGKVEQDQGTKSLGWESEASNHVSKMVRVGIR